MRFLLNKTQNKRCSLHRVTGRVALFAVFAVAFCLPSFAAHETGTEVATVADSFEYTDSNPQPSGRLRVSRPSISWKISGGNGANVSDVVLQVDGETVKAEYSQTKKSVWYEPTEAFTPGTHKIDCAVQLGGQVWVNRSWQFTVLAGASATPQAPNTQQTALFTQINLVRKEQGLPPVTLDGRLCAAAQAHTAYLSPRATVAHIQTDETSGDFLARDSGERAGVFGFSGGVFEVIGQGKGDDKTQIARLFAAPYHRGAFLQPGSVAIGAGKVNGTVTLMFGTGDQTGVTTYPAPHQTNVPTAWDGIEAPNPLRLHKGAGTGPLGTAISLHVWTGDITEKLTNVQATLTTATGKSVAVWLNTPQNDDHLTNAVFLLPQKPLAPATMYRVTVSATTATGETVRREWTFTTAK